MTGFSSEWLRLREPVDHKARSEEVLAAMVGWFSRDKVLKITDIGSGTGSTLRAIRPVLDQKISWNLVDNDPALLDVAKEEARDDRVNFSFADLSISLDPLFTQPVDLMTTSAFLDLVSLDWLEVLVGEVTKRKIPFYAALTYDGRAGCKPTLSKDDVVIDAFNDHQKTDKGFGNALGPEAADIAISLFKASGYQVISAESDWHGDNKNNAFQKMLLEGWHAAATEIRPNLKNDFDEWLRERIDLIENSKAEVFVGHKDLFAVPK